jgi:hypothetical protein
MNRKLEGYHDDDPGGYLPIIPQAVQAASQRRTDCVDVGNGPPSIRIQRAESIGGGTASIFDLDGETTSTRRERDGDNFQLGYQKTAGGGTNQHETTGLSNRLSDGEGKARGHGRLSTEPMAMQQQLERVRGGSSISEPSSSLSSSSSSTSIEFSSSALGASSRTATAGLPAQQPAAEAQESSAEEDIVIPNNFDILSGRGRRIQTNLGNVLLHQIVDLHRGRYNTAPRSERRDIAENIVRALYANGNRFLSRVVGTAGLLPEGWNAISHDEAIDKVAHCFRSRRRIPY